MSGLDERKLENDFDLYEFKNLQNQEDTLAIGNTPILMFTKKSALDER